MTPGLYRTRSGHKARVLCNDAPGPYPNVGYIEVPLDGIAYTLGSIVCGWRWDGRRSLIEETASDIIGPWEEAT